MTSQYDTVTTPNPPHITAEEFWGILSAFLGHKKYVLPQKCTKNLPCSFYAWFSTSIWPSPLHFSPSLSSHISHSSLSSIMAKALLPPAPVLVLLPSNRAIVLTSNNNTALCNLQGVMLTRAHILPTGKWVDLEHLPFDPEPPAHGPFHGHFRCWADSQRYEKRGTKDTMQGNWVADNTTRRGGQRTRYKAIVRWRWWVGMARQGENTTIKLRLWQWLEQWAWQLTVGRQGQWAR
jgi:hypothetical protein